MVYVVVYSTFLHAVKMRLQMFPATIQDKFLHHNVTLPPSCWMQKEDKCTAVASLGPPSDSS